MWTYNFLYTHTQTHMRVHTPLQEKTNMDGETTSHGDSRIIMILTIFVQLSLRGRYC